MNIVEGQIFDEEELFEILRADFSIGSGAITELYDEKVTPTESYYHMVFGSGIKSCICIRIWDDSNGT